jgi:hypothetical protein
MALFVKAQDNTYDKCNAYVKTPTGWKEIKNIYVKTLTGWKPIWTYIWKMDVWSACSAPCGGGTQIRTVTCVRNDNVTKQDIFCSHLGNKPIVMQVCNTQSCAPTELYFVWSSDGYGYGVWTSIKTAQTKFIVDESGVYEISAFIDVVWRQTGHRSIYWKIQNELNTQLLSCSAVYNSAPSCGYYLASVGSDGGRPLRTLKKTIPYAIITKSLMEGDNYLTVKGQVSMGDKDTIRLLIRDVSVRKIT